MIDRPQDPEDADSVIDGPREPALAHSALSVDLEALVILLQIGRMNCLLVTPRVAASFARSPYLYYISYIMQIWT